MGMLYDKLIPPHLNLLYRISNMESMLPEFNNLISEAMNRKVLARHARHYRRDGIEVPVIFLAASTIILIFLCVYYSI